MKNFRLVGNPIDTPAKETKFEKITVFSSKPSTAKKTPELLHIAKKMHTNSRLQSRESATEYVQKMVPKKSASTSHSSDNLTVVNDYKLKRLESENFVLKQLVEELQSQVRIHTDLNAENEELKKQIAELLRKV